MEEFNKKKQKRKKKKDKKHKADYEVGYARPPKAHQFKAGQSGNPKGRPKDPKTIKEALKKTLASKLTTRNADGEEIKINCAEALVKKTISEALSKDGPTRRMFFKEEFMNLEAEEEKTEEVQEEETPSDVDKRYKEVMTPERRTYLKQTILSVLDERYHS